MTPDLRIYITPKDIREGRPTYADACAVARATRRAIARVMGITPERVTITAEVNALIYENGTVRYLWWRSSSALHAWINSYDAGLSVKPASFILKGDPHQ